MRLKLNSKTRIAIPVGVILVASILAIGYLNNERSSKIATPETLVTISDKYSDVATALKSNPSTEQSAMVGDAAAAAAYSLRDNSEILSWNDQRRWPIASLTKLMTAIVVSESMATDTPITITSADEAPLVAANAAPIFKVGDTVTIKDLMASMFVVSSDDAAEALADNYGRERFLQAMNDTAISLGMDDTRFVSPSGLSAGNLSTASDLYKLVEFIWSRYPGFFKITREAQTTISVSEPSGSRVTMVLNNIDRFAGRADFLGGKTGTLPISKQNLIAIFNANGPKVIIVLGATDRYTEAKDILSKL